MELSERELKVTLQKKADVLNLSQNYSNPEWVEKQVRKGRLTRAMADLIPQLMEAGEIAFPGKWDIQFEYDLRVRRTSHINSYGYSTFDTDKFHHTLTHNRISEQDLYDLVKHYVLENHYRPLRQEFDLTYSIKTVITRVRFVVHFPDVTITNKYRQSHDIKDLFIALVFNSQGEVTNDIQGNRSTFSELEVVGKYIHSHLTSTDFKDRNEPLKYKSFCKGTGSIISCLSFYNADKSLPNLLSILYHLNTTANHESIDGGPHYRMESLMAKEGLSKAPTDSEKQEMWSDVMTAIYVKQEEEENFVPLPLDWAYSNNRYTVVDNDKLNTFCTEYVKRTDSKKWLVMKADNGLFYKQTTSLNFRRNDYPDYKRFIPFRGQRYEFTVYSKPGPTITDRKIYIHPLIREYVKSQLESHAAKAAFKSSAIEFLDSLGNN